MIKIDLSEAKKFIDANGDRENAKIVMLTLIGKDVVSIIKTDLVESGTWTTGDTGRSIHYKMKENGVDVLGGSWVTEAIETGSKPGTKPSIESLRRWSRLKLGNENLAYAVAKKIERKGTRAKGMLSDAFEQLENEVIPNRIAYLTERWTQ